MQITKALPKSGQADVESDTTVPFTHDAPHKATVPPGLLFLDHTACEFFFQRQLPSVLQPL